MHTPLKERAGTAPFRIAVLLIASVLVLCLYLTSFSSSGPSISPLIQVSLEQHYRQMTCGLVKLPIFPDDIVPYFNANYSGDLPLDIRGNFDNPDDCIQLEKLTKMEEGVLVPLDHSLHCWGRCLSRKRDNSYKLSDWQPAGTKMSCDVVEAKCSNTTEMSRGRYWMFHQNLVEREDTPKDKDLYDIYIIMQDSVSAPHAKRSLNKTLTYIQEVYQAVDFPFVNRIGVNTYPNMMPFIVGSRVEAVSNKLYGTNDGHLRFIKNCGELSGSGNLLKIVRDTGYKTMFSDDYLHPIQSTKCTGYSQQFADHVLDPLFIRLHEGRFSGKSIFPKHCWDLPQETIDYLDRFVHSYADRPKAALVLETWGSHNTFKDIQLMDRKYLKFFQDNRDRLKESFIIFMGDHGFRMGDAAKTRSGQRELNNPMTYVMIPETLRRDNSLMTALRENAGNLQNIMDTRATVLDIVKNFRKKGGVAPFDSENSTEEGQSFLRRQTPMNCYTKGISLNYCICELKKKSVSSSSSLAAAVGQAAVSSLNDAIRNFRRRSLCSPWNLDKTLAIDQLSEIPDAYSVEFRTKDPAAHFLTVIRYVDNSTYVTVSFDRLDTFGDHGHCVDGLIKHICHCRKPRG